MSMIKEYPTKGYVQLKDGRKLPILDLPFMSDEKWNRMCKEDAVKRFTEDFGHEPETVEQAVNYQRKRIDAIMQELSDNKPLHSLMQVALISSPEDLRSANEYLVQLNKSKA